MLKKQSTHGGPLKNKVRIKIKQTSRNEKPKCKHSKHLLSIFSIESYLFHHTRIKTTLTNFVIGAVIVKMTGSLTRLFLQLFLYFASSYCTEGKPVILSLFELNSNLPRQLRRPFLIYISFASFQLLNSIPFHPLDILACSLISFHKPSFYFRSNSSTYITIKLFP